jgi:hypothetical protein
MHLIQQRKHLRAQLGPDARVVGPRHELTDGLQRLRRRGIQATSQGKLGGRRFGHGGSGSSNIIGRGSSSL